MRLTVLEGRLPLELFTVRGVGEHAFDPGHTIAGATSEDFEVVVPKL